MKNYDQQTEAITFSEQQNLYDLNMLYEMDGNEYVVQLVTMFLKEAPACLKEMKNALDKGDKETLYKTAHKLKGNAGVLQAATLIELLNSIELIAKTAYSKNILAEFMEEAYCLYTVIEKALKKDITRFI
jgi:HPt (histidine-containing phosphotransfer) domain-containing protein